MVFLLDDEIQAYGLGNITQAYIYSNFETLNANNHILCTSKCIKQTTSMHLLSTRVLDLVQEF
jgi:hypothetical protein